MTHTSRHAESSVVEARTWNDYTRSVVFANDMDFDAVGARLRKEFAGAEVYPDFTNDIQPIQQGLAAFKAHLRTVALPAVLPAGRARAPGTPGRWAGRR